MEIMDLAIPAVYLFVFFPMAFIAWYDVIDVRWRSIQSVGKKYWWISSTLLWSFSLSAIYLGVQVHRGDFAEVGNTILAIMTSFFVLHKICRAESILKAHQKIIHGPVRLAQNHLHVLFPSQDPGSNDNSHEEMSKRISAVLLDDDYPGSISARIKWLRPEKKKIVVRDDAEELSTTIAIFMRLAVTPVTTEFWNAICSTHKLITATGGRVSIGKQLLRLITNGSLGLTPAHAQMGTDDKTARNPIQNLLINNNFDETTEDMHKNLMLLGVQMYWIGVEQSETAVESILQRFPHKFIQGKSGQEMIMEIAILLILQHSKWENPAASHGVSPVDSSSRLSRSWHDFSLQMEVMESCADAMAHLFQFTQVKESQAPDYSLSKCKCESAENLSFKEDRGFVVEFLKMLCFEHFPDGTHDKRGEGTGEFETPRQNIMFALIELVLTAKHAGRVVDALFFSNLETSSDCNTSPKASSDENMDNDPKSLTEAMEKRGIFYCPRCSVRDAEIVWGLAGLMTALGITDRSKVRSNMAAMNPFQGGNSDGPESERDMIQRLHNLHKSKKKTSKYDMLSAELWLLGHDDLMHMHDPCPNNFDIFAAHSEMAQALAVDLFAVMKKHWDLHHDHDEKKSFLDSFSTETYGNSEEYQTDWKNYKLKIQGKARPRRIALAGRSAGQEEGKPLQNQTPSIERYSSSRPSIERYGSSRSGRSSFSGTCIRCAHDEEV